MMSPPLAISAYWRLYFRLGVFAYRQRMCNEGLLGVTRCGYDTQSWHQSLQSTTPIWNCKYFIIATKDHFLSPQHLKWHLSPEQGHRRREEGFSKEKKIRFSLESHKNNSQ